MIARAAETVRRNHPGISPTVGHLLGGRVFRMGTALGAPAWGPSALARDLELRLGLPAVTEDPVARLPKWTARIKALGAREAFYARSLEVDEVGTAAALLEWRDALVESGWRGQALPGGGARLEALAAIEAHPGESLPPGAGERLARIERALSALRPVATTPIYAQLSLLDDVTVWPGRWRKVFGLLEERGTQIVTLRPDLPGAPADSDLGELQARLRGEPVQTKLRGDGTVVLLRGNTSVDLAEPVAITLARGRASGARDLVVRCSQPQSLEAALPLHDLPSQGHSSRSAWRPAMQLLPLAVELSFEPRDPQRLLELLTLPVGPFRGMLGARLARAVSRQPGVGGKEWSLQKEEAKARLLDRQRRAELERGTSQSEADRIAGDVVAKRLAELDAWLEVPPSQDGRLSRASLLAVVARVRDWLHARLRGDDREIYFPAHAQSALFEAAVANDPREQFSQEETRQLLDRYARVELPHDVSIDSAGRVAHVDHPAAILGSCDRAILWNLVGGVERRAARPPWSIEELSALSAAGVQLPEPTAVLAAETDAWRRSILAARVGVVLVIPRTIEATETTDHPLWDEIRGRLALDHDSIERITHDVSRIIDGTAQARRVPVTALTPLRLPEARSAWHVDSALLRSDVARANTTSVSELEALVTCPLAWAFEHRALLRRGGAARIADGPLLNGILGHRLVEELHADRAFDLAENDFVAQASARFDELLRTEGATLLLPGASIERLQLQRQVRHAMRELHRYLARTERQIASVEETVSVDSPVGPLHGRLDLRLVDRHTGRDREAILDLKWGTSRYRDALLKGRAVQLAVYARALARGASSEPPAGYFVLGTGRVLAGDPRMAPDRVLDGPSLPATWSRAMNTASLVRESVDRGALQVVGTKVSLPLLEALGVRDDERGRHYDVRGAAACTYCDYAALCGRKWEKLS